ncbi:DUF6457 domain-containing protein [Homoserinimonas sp. OAct 916]|uniref:DUF6457 domain-containing protein n=1 Tax=Homoserinimonas sp. OAct 916 TaxID=2211450 RepID=UPI0013003472|nr:DUF6457 domain-containing protein [Homoserinimonas sp. OAct 916]
MDRPEEDAILIAWCAEVSEALGLDHVEVDIKKLLGLAGRAAHQVLRPAAPLTTYLVGYAAGLAAASEKSAGDAADEATEIALRLCATREQAGQQ